MKQIFNFLIAFFILGGIANAQTFYSWRYRSHATDCTSLTDGKSKDLCQDLDDGATWQCIPTSGNCNTTAEWIKVSPFFQTGSNLYFSTGNVGIGTTTPASKLHLPTGQSIQIGSNTFITDIAGETWISSNAKWDGTNFQKIVSAQNAVFAQIMGGNKGWPIGGDPIIGTRAGEGSLSDGFAMWRNVGGGPTQIENNFAGVNGLSLMFGSLYGNFAIEGQGFELDGNVTIPYGRIIHNPALSSVNTGIATNVYADFSGRDITADPSWFAGRRNDSFTIRRLAGSATINDVNFVHLLDITSSGNVAIGTTVPTEKLEVKGGNIYLNNTNSKIIMKSPDGLCKSCSVNNGSSFSCVTAICN